MGDVDRSITHGKKRARIGGTRIVKRPEIKKINMGFAADGYALTSVIMGSTPNMSASLNRTQWPAWVPMSLQVPQAGPDGYNRIGNNINLKWIKFKGYVRSYINLAIPVHWRLVLYRTPFQITISGDANHLDITNWGSLWENWEDPFASGIGSATRWDRSVHNFFKLSRKVDLWHEVGINRTVLAKGTLAPHQSRSLIKFTRTMQAGSETGISDGTTYDGTNDSFQKRNVADYLNARVTVNDTFNCSTRCVFYYVVLETDSLYGMTYNNDQSTTVDAISGVWDNRLFELNFFIRGYFTDP